MCLIAYLLLRIKQFQNSNTSKYYKVNFLNHFKKQNAINYNIQKSLTLVDWTKVRAWKSTDWIQGMSNTETKEIKTWINVLFRKTLATLYLYLLLINNDVVDLYKRLFIRVLYQITYFRTAFFMFPWSDATRKGISAVENNNKSSLPEVKWRKVPNI